MSTVADQNVNRFVAFRVLFNARFYYPVLGVLFLDLGLSATEYTLLNFVWAIVIVFAEVPSGALADRLGRKPLMVAAAVCMVFEMLALLFAPRNGGVLLLGLCLLNRVLSGVAEAMASGADESLAYDSLALENRSGEWPGVLARVMRSQSFAMPVAMLLGATVYDASLINKTLRVLGSTAEVSTSLTLRMPIALTLISAIAVCVIAFGLEEPAPVATEAKQRSSWSDIVAAGTWILRSPIALFAILGGVLLDSVVRLFMTFASVFYRLIDLPASSYGIVGASMGAIGLVVSPITAWLVRTGSLKRNYVVLAGVAMVGLVGVALRIPLWGVLFTIPLVGTMMALGFILSSTLNELVSSEQRATVLSFKGLVFNLGYGFVSLLFALALRVLRGSGTADEAFAKALQVLPLWLLCTLIVLALAFRNRMRSLQK
jgi:MFS family permease